MKMRLKPQIDRRTDKILSKGEYKPPQSSDRMAADQMRKERKMARIKAELDERAMKKELEDDIELAGGIENYRKLMEDGDTVSVADTRKTIQLDAFNRHYEDEIKKYTKK